MGVRLPAEYQEVEYLESTGTQYLVAPFDETPNIVHAKGRFMYVNLTTTEDDWDCIFGVPYLSLGYNRTDKLRFLNTSYRYGFVNFRDISALTIYDFEAYQSGSELSVTLNGERKTGTTTQTTFVESNLYIFAMRVGYGYGDMRIYNLKAYSTIDDSNLIRDFVPCYRKADNKPGMYDLVTNQFFTNAGTGEFLVGPDVLGSISPLMVAWRRMLMRKPSPIPTGYVTDGLLLWLDAICNTRNGHDANALYWEDLSVNHRDYAIGESGLIFGQSVVSFTTVNHKAITTEKAFTSAEQQQIRDNLATIEIGVDFAGSGYQIVLPLGNQHGTINFCNLSGSRTLSFHPNSTSESVSLLGGLHGYNSELWVDGVKQESTDFRTTWTNVRLNLMFSYTETGSAYSFLGDIAYIRVYNRRLTDAELMQNWLRDKARYNL